MEIRKRVDRIFEVKARGTQFTYFTSTKATCFTSTKRASASPAFSNSRPAVLSLLALLVQITNTDATPGTKGLALASPARHGDSVSPIVHPCLLRDDFLTLVDMPGVRIKGSGDWPTCLGYMRMLSGK
jgi:hypothetical protein